MPSQLNSCVFEVVQCATSAAETQDFSGWISLVITIIGWPIVYKLGVFSNRKAEVNRCIDQLDNALNELRCFAVSLDGKSFKTADYHTLVALFHRVRNVCVRIEQLNGKIARPKETLLELKKIATDELVSKKDKDAAVSKLLSVETALTHYYKKSA